MSGPVLSISVDDLMELELPLETSLRRRECFDCSGVAGRVLNSTLVYECRECGRGWVRHEHPPPTLPPDHVFASCYRWSGVGWLGADRCCQPIAKAKP